MRHLLMNLMEHCLFEILMILMEWRVGEVPIQVMTLLMTLCVWDPFCHVERRNYPMSEELAMLVVWGYRIEL
jgi:hypothetical protein